MLGGGGGASKCWGGAKHVGGARMKLGEGGAHPPRKSASDYGPIDRLIL